MKSLHPRSAILCNTSIRPNERVRCTTGKLGAAMDLPSPIAGNEKNSTSPLWLEIRMRNGALIKKQFRLPRASLESCVQHASSDPFDVEMMHKCKPRSLLLRQLQHLVPAMVETVTDSWLRTVNKDGNGSKSPFCLFDGAQLEVNVSSPLTPEFGLCFSRLSFAAERELLDFDAMSNHPTGDWKGWTRREPSDTDRLRVNKRGREILYFVQPPLSECDVTVSELKAELCHTLQIESQRISLAAGPFIWGPGFVEDGLGVYATYFDTDVETDLHHMKTIRGAALIDVVEMSVQAQS